jgi:hypothetical protein
MVQQIQQRRGEFNEGCDSGEALRGMYETQLSWIQSADRRLRQIPANAIDRRINWMLRIALRAVAGP